jgi:heme exporter protein A
MLTAMKLECMRGNRRLFHSLTFSVNPGECLQLTGPNGSGKTTLIRILCGLQEPTNGNVIWKGADIRRVAEEYRSSITYLGHRHGIQEDLSALENLQIFCGLNGVEVGRQRAICALEWIGLPGRETVLARFLSEGERRRIALARLMLTRAKLWLLDEVLTSLDRAGSHSVRMLLDKHVADGGMAVVATHQELQLSQGPLQRLELAA